MKIKIFLSSRFEEFKDLREYIIQNGFKEIGLDIEIVALDKEPLANFLSPKEASIEGVEISNIYMLFLGKTYGTIPKDDVVSFPHREYKEAKRLGLPVLVFLTNDEKREEKVEEFIKEIEENEIYGIISRDVKKDYELVLKSLKEVILKLTHYGIKYVTKLNQVDFDLLEKKSKESISDLGERYIGNKYDCIITNMNIDKNYFFYLDKNIWEKDFDNRLNNFLGTFFFIVKELELEDGEKLKNIISNASYIELKNNFSKIFNNEKVKKILDILLSSKTLEKTRDYLFIRFLNSFHSIQTFCEKYFNISKKKQLLLKGEALIGKTHLFCEIVKERLKNKKPTILFFGHQFKEDKSIVRNMIDLLGIDISEEVFLESLNILGKKYNSRVLIMIDAVNETNGNLWKNGIISFSNKIKNYEYLALALSIRDVEEYKLIDSSNENFIKENFEIIEHYGINLTLKDIEKICKCLGIEIINIPTHMFNLFVNPGIMWIYLENIKKTSKKVNIKDVISPLDLFESIFDSLSERFNNRYSVNNKDELLNVLEDIIEFGLKDNFSFEIKKRKLIRELKKENYDSNILDFLISEGILREENEKIYFRYQKFENYFIMKYLLENYEEKEILEKLIETENEALLEAFVLLLPLKGIEIFDLDENLLQNEKIVKYFINSLIWRNKELIKETTKKYLNIFFNEFYKDEIFEMILHSSLIPNHPFNAEFLHTILKDLSIVKRDYIWSLFIHNSFENEKNVKRIIEWVLDLEDEKLVFEEEIATFYGITLSWFFTSSNRKLRDLATKALVKIFVNNLEIIPDILEKFKEVNDLYVLERILAAIYGAVLIVEKNENFYNIAKKIFEIVFKDKVIEHIMIRDYAYLTIDFISKRIKLDFDISKIYPPYDSKLPDDFPKFEKFEEKLKKKFKFSYNKSLGKINLFIENIFFKTLANFILVEKNEKIFSIYSYYTKDYFKELTQIKENLKSKFIESFFNLINEDDVYLYLLIDKKETRLRKEKARSKYYQDRLRYWIDNSITIKYKWIVFYKLLSIIADNFKVFRNEYEIIERTDYKGSWQIGIRDIDPTYLNCKNKENFQIDVNIDFLENKSNEEWIRYKKDLFFIEDILVYKNNVVLETFFSERKIINIGNKFFPRKIEINVKSFFVENKNLDNFLEYVENNIKEINNLIINLKRKYEQQIYLREYFDSKVFEEISREQLLFELNFLNKISNGILSTSLFFYETRLFNDHSFKRETSDFILPSEWLIEEMNLVRKKENIWLNRENKIVCKSYDNALIMRKNIFMNFLDKNNLNLVWMFYINKKFLKSEDYHLIDYSEENRIYGLAYFKNNKLRKVFNNDL